MFSFLGKGTDKVQEQRRVFAELIREEAELEAWKLLTRRKTDIQSAI